MLESPIALAARRIALLFLLITAAACPVRPGDAQEPRGPRLTQDQVKQLQEAQRHGQQAGKLLDEGKTGEAIRAWQKKLAIERRVFGSASPPVVHSLQVLARMLAERDDLAGAQKSLQEVVAIQTRLRAKTWQINDAKRAVGDVSRLGRLAKDERRRLREARKHNQEVLTLYGQGKAAAALPLARQVVAAFKEILGEDHLDYAKALNNLATVYKELGELAQAEPLYQQVMSLARRQVGENHPFYANSLNNLGLVYQDLGEYEKAEPLLQKAIEIKKRALGEKSPEYAQDLNNLAGLYWTRADYARAEPLFQKALSIRRQTLGEKHPVYATALTNLGLLYRDAGMYPKAEPLLKKAIVLRRDNLGEKHPDYAASLNNLAVMYFTMRRYELAESLFNKALRSARLAHGDKHPDYAASLMNLASINDAQGSFAKAEPLLEKAAAIYKKALGDKHPDYASAEARLAWVYASTRRESKAADAFDNARRSLHAHAARVLPGGPQGDQLTFLYQDVHLGLQAALALALNNRASQTLPARSAAWLLNAKALAPEVLAEPALATRDRADRVLAPKARDLATVRRQLVEQTFAPVASSADEDRDEERNRDPERNNGPPRERKSSRLDKLSQLYRRADSLNRVLGRPVQPWVELSSVRKALPSGAVLIDLAKVALADFKAKGKEPQWLEAHYAAWVVPSVGKGKVQVFDLGEAKPIEDAARELYKAMHAAPEVIKDRGELLAEKDLRAPLEAVARLLLRPMSRALAGATHLVISPDADLWQVPWAALPLTDGKYAIERLQVTLVVSGRDLVQPRSKRSLARSLVMADPDYDLKSSRGAHAQTGDTGPRSLDKLPVFKRVPGAAAWATELSTLVERYAKNEPAVYNGKEVRVNALKAARRPRLVALATQSFFLEDQNDPAALASHTANDSRPAEPSGKPPMDSTARNKKAKMLESPLIRCGLALAGANASREEEAVLSNEGILTGSDILSADLRGTELVLLPDAEVGPAPAHSGEARACLRQAFQVAGSPAVVAPGWQLGAAEKTELLRAFLDHLATMKLRGKALRQAQLDVIKKRRADNKAAHPYYWAAYSLTGRW
jgi:tetratricopeptide (TPR) repeat protein/CHAT domain-containing protein